MFVAWDDGKFRTILAEHLQAIRSNQKRASNFRMTVASLGDLSGFFTTGSRDNDLVHKATKDLWAVKQSEGGYSIVRLFKDNGEPLKG